MSKSCSERRHLLASCFLRVWRPIRPRHQSIHLTRNTAHFRMPHSTEEAANPSAITGNGSNGCSGSSHIAIEENFISIRAGGAEGQTKQSSSPRATAFRSVPSSRAAAIAAPSACVSSTGEALSERGLSVEVVGPTSVQSTEVRPCSRCYVQMQKAKGKDWTLNT